MFSKVQKVYLSKIAVVWAGAVLLCLLGYYFILVPQNRKVEDLNRNFNLMEQQVLMSQAESTPEAKSRLRKELSDTQEQINEFLIDPEVSSSLALHIGRLAGESGVRGFSSKSATNQLFREIANCERIGFQSIDLSFKGSFNHFASFISSLERHDPVILIDRFRIYQSLKREQGHEVSMVLAILINKKPVNIPLHLTLDYSENYFGKSEKRSDTELPVSVSSQEIVITE